MAHNTITDGPSPWNLMLVMFDEHPAGASGLREVSFSLMCGERFHMQVNSLEKPDPSMSANDSERSLWTLTGNSSSMPNGYYYSDRNSLLVRYNPYSREGYVDLKVACPRCGHFNFGTQVRADITVRICAQCNAYVMKKDNLMQTWEWLDQASASRRAMHGMSVKVRYLSDGPINF